MTWQLTTYADEAAWLEARRGFVTSSDIPAILGVSPFSDPFSLWLAKVRPADDTETRARRRRFEAAHEAEPRLARWFAEDSGREPFRPAEGHHLITNPALPWAAVTPDLLVIDGRGPDGQVELKQMSPMLRSGYAAGEHFLYANAQLHLGLLVMGLEDGWVYADFGGWEQQMFPVKRDAALSALILERGELFRGYVASQEPPDESFLIGGEELRKALARIFEGETGEEVAVEHRFAAMARRHAEIGPTMKELEDERDKIAAAFMLRLGEATYGRIPGHDKIAKFHLRRGGAEGVDTRWEKRVLSFVNDPTTKKGRKRP